MPLRFPPELLAEPDPLDAAGDAQEACCEHDRILHAGGAEEYRLAW